MRILTILFVLTIAFSAQADIKLVATYLINGPVDTLNVVLLSDKLVLEKVVSQTLPTPGGITNILTGDGPGEFSVYYNRRNSNGLIKIDRIDFQIAGKEILMKGTKTLNQKSNSLLNFDINDGIGSVQLTNNTIGRFTVNQDLVQEFRNITRDVLPGQAYASSQVRVETPSGTNDFHGSLFQFSRNGALSANVFFNNVIDGTRQNPKYFQFVGPDTPRNMTLLRGCGRSFFFGSHFRTSPQGKAQIGHKGQELDNNDFHAIGSNIQIDQFRDHRNPDASYYKTLGLALHNYHDGTCGVFTMFDRFNNAKNSNHFFVSAYVFGDSSGPTRFISPKPLDPSILNSVVAYGGDIEAIEID